MDKTNSGNEPGKEAGKDPLQNALEKAAEQEKMYKGPANKIDDQVTDPSLDEENDASSADDSGE